MEECKIKNLYNLDETIAKELLGKFEYPWEVLPEINDFILEIGPKLDPEVYELKGENIWIAKSANVYPSAYIKGPAIIGESIKRILNLKGYKTIGDVHLGDYGLQIGEVIYGLKKENIPLSELNIDLLNRIYPQMSALAKSDEEVYNECKRITSELQKGNAEYKEYYKKIKEVSVNDIKRLYDYLGVSFDLWLGESDSEPYIPKLMNELESRNLVVVDQGAKIVNIKRDTDKKEMPPVIVEKSDGSAIYATTDLATIMQRVEKYDPKYILYVVDARQSLHFEGVFRIAQMLGYTNNLEHIAFGTINGSDGKPFKTRSGETLKLDELINNTKEIFLSKREENKNMSSVDLDKIVNSIIKYADLQNNREKSYNFDIAKFSEVSGKTGPYILYSALRIRKILTTNTFNKGNVSDIIYNDIDKNLRLKLLDFNKYLDKAIEDRLPSVIAEYVYDLANLLNSFYQNINISKIEDETMKNDYLNILDLSFNVLKECLDLLIIELPSEM